MFTITPMYSVLRRERKEKDRPYTCTHTMLTIKPMYSVLRRERKEKNRLYT